MPQDLPYLKETASQTAGPYVHIGLAPGAAGFKIYARELGNDMIAADTPGERIRIEGMVFDGTGAPVKDALIEAWQADGDGVHPHLEDPRQAEAAPGFRGWARILTDFHTGLFAFDTIKLWIVARGINIGLQTRLYFEDEAEANKADPILNLIEQEQRRATLMARREARDGQTVYRFDIRLQGEGETVFFDL